MFPKKSCFTKGEASSFYYSKFLKEKTVMVELFSSKAVDFDGNASFSECQGLKHIPMSCLSSKLVDASLLVAGSYEPC